MKLSLLAGTTSKLIDIYIQNTATGAGLTGLTSGSGSLSWYYYREGAATSTSVAAQSMTLGTWTTRGFIVVDGTNMPGLYQLGVPDAALAAGAKSVVMLLFGAANMAPVVLEIELTAVDNQDAVRYGMTALPNAAASGVGGLLTAPTTANVGLSDLSRILGTALSETAGLLAGGFKKFFNVATPTGTLNSLPDAVAGATNGLFIAGTNAATTITTSLTTTFTGNLTGNVGGNVGGNVTGSVGSVTGLSTALTTLQADTDDIQTRLPAALVGGRIDASVGAVASGAIVAASFAANALDAVWSTTTRLLSAGTNIVLAKGTGVTGFTDLDAAGVRTATGLASANLDTQLAGIDTDVLTRLATTGYTVPPTANANADALLDRTAGVETGLTVRQWLRLAGAALLGKASGLATTTAVFRDTNDTKDRISAIVDSSGNRTAVTLDAS